MKKIIVLMVAIIMSNLGIAQEVSPVERAKKDVVQIKQLIELDEGSYKYIESLLVYYYNNGGDPHSEDTDNKQIVDNVYGKLRAKLSKETFDSLYEKWLRNHVK